MKKSCLETIHDYIDFWSTETPDNVAVNAPLRIPLVYKQLKDHVEYVAFFLNKMGIGQKNRVAIVLPNGPEMATAFISVAAYCSSAPLNQNYRAKEYQFYLTDLNAKAVILPKDIS